MKKYYYLFTLAICLGFTQEDSTPVREHLRMHHLYIPERDLRAKDRIMRQEEKKIVALYTKGEPNTYRLIINKDEVHEEIFTLQHFIPTQQMDMRDAVRRYQSYNKEVFLIYHNQNGFFPVAGNEYYLVNESHARVYEIIADGQIHRYKEPDSLKYSKVIETLCKYKTRIYTVPHEMCE